MISNTTINSTSVKPAASWPEIGLFCRIIYIQLAI
jgi:hypothetical protein